MISAPFFSEIGWELLRWQGHIRHIKPESVYCAEGHEYLYEDFCTPIPCRANIVKKDKWKAENHSDRHEGWWDVKFDIKPSKEICENPNLKQEFFQYGRKRYGGKMEYDILLHHRTAKRKCDKKTGDRTYKHWEELCKHFKGLKIGWIGTRAESGVPVDIGNDLRGLPLQTVADLCANSKFVMGPSSGIAHFANLCDCKALVWTDKRKWNLGGKKGSNWRRYMTAWNPFKTNNIVLDDDGWQPSAERVLKAIEKNHLL